MSPSPSKRPSRIRRMFGDIASNYDFLNRLLSFGVDRLWRRRMVGMVRGRTVLDVACGTGDVLRTLLKRRDRVRAAGVDFSRPMLDRAARKLRGSTVEEARWDLVQGDALSLPFRARTFSAVTVAFGVRNFAERRRGFREILRVLQPGGVHVILEFFPPPDRWYLKPFRWYLRHVLPRIGRLVSGSEEAYGYLRDSINAFCGRDGIRRELEDVGFRRIRFRDLHGGIATLVRGVKPDDGEGTVTG